MKTYLATPDGQAVTTALGTLLSEKHLYQYAEIRTDFLETRIKEGLRAEPNASFAQFNLKDEMAKAVAHFLAKNWRVRFAGEKPNPGVAYDSLDFELPTVLTYCEICSDRWPFNAVNDPPLPWQGIADGQCFCLLYQCQSCKGPAIWYLVKREGLKLRLCGRAPLEVLPVPKVLPKTIAKFYSDALVAHHAGQTLAGLFLLRVFVEQFWHSVPDVAKMLIENAKATGDEQGAAYQGTLPHDFKSRFPSLSKVYADLSAALHSADPDGALFEDAAAKILEHFDARRLFKIR